MTEQELREKIAKRFYEEQTGLYDWDSLPDKKPTGKGAYLKHYRGDFYGFANSVLALIKEALPELAKENGYVKLAEDQDERMRLLDQAFDWVQPYLKRSNRIASVIEDNNPSSTEWMIADQHGDPIDAPYFTLEGVKK